MRVGYLGPAGTFSHEALSTDPRSREWDLVGLPTIYDAVMAVHERAVDSSLVPIENSLEGSVNATLDALAFETQEVAIVGELVHPVRHCLIARTHLELEQIQTVYSHPQASGQCARFIRKWLTNAVVVPAVSTADAVRIVAGLDAPAAALSTRLAAGLYGCEILRGGVEDMAENETRFVWLGPAGDQEGGTGPWKTSVVFWGVGAGTPGWLVGCLSEFAFRGVNLTKIESRPRKQGLGRYMFFVDLEGRDGDPPVAGALEALRSKTETVRVIGSYPAT
ncbi:MAG: prephenate dehydratase [Solirubrobacteraceae bacterium]